MYGLPDSAVYGTYKRMKGRGRGVSTPSTFWSTLFWLIWHHFADKKQK